MKVYRQHYKYKYYIPEENNTAWFIPETKFELLHCT